MIIPVPLTTPVVVNNTSTQSTTVSGCYDTPVWLHIVVYYFGVIFLLFVLIALIKEAVSDFKEKDMFMFLLNVLILIPLAICVILFMTWGIFFAKPWC